MFEHFQCCDFSFNFLSLSTEACYCFLYRFSHFSGKTQTLSVTRCLFKLSSCFSKNVYQQFVMLPRANQAIWGKQNSCINSRWSKTFSCFFFREKQRKCEIVFENTREIFFHPLMNVKRGHDHHIIS